MLCAVQHPVPIQTVRCETSVLSMTGMLWAGVLGVIVVRVMTERAD